MASLLQTVGISQTFGGLRAANRVTFESEERSITSLIGPNGAGKTTVFNMISGFLPPNEGEIRFRGEAIQQLKPFEIARRGIGRTFQDPRLFPAMSVLENVMVGVRQIGERPFRALFGGRRVAAERDAVRTRSLEMLKAVGLAERAGDQASSLSFGEQRFLSIARTLVGDPALILMDEPTVGLDKAALAKLLDLMTKLVAERGITLLLIEHNMDVVMSVSSRIVLLVQGEVMASGTPAEVRQHRSMTDAYLGPQHAAVGH